MGQGLRDAIIHCVLGGVYSVRDRNLKEDKRTGDLLPPVSQLGVAAGSGLLRPRGGDFGDDETLNLFSAQFNMHGVFRHRLERQGATFKSKDEPFLASRETDFHPTDVLEDADGSLLVVDTGAWFRSCPTSQIGMPNVFGAIYRVRREGARPPKDPRGLKMKWSKVRPGELVHRLDDPRFAVRDRAADALVRLGAEAVPALRRGLHESKSVRQRREMVWTLARIDEPEARGPTRFALNDPDASVRLAAAAAVGLYRDVDGQGKLRKIVVSDDLPVRREAAAALARIRHPESVPSLLEGLSTGGGDRFYEHAVIHALIMIGDRKSTLAGLNSENPRVSHGALIALDQMEGGGLTPALVIPLLDGPDPEIHKAALQIIASRPAWAGKSVNIFRKMLAKEPADETHREELRQRLLGFSKFPEIQDLLGEVLHDKATPTGIRILLLETIARAPISELPASWTTALRAALSSSDERVVRQAVATAHARSILMLREPLLALARDPKRPEDLRVEAIDTVAPQIARLDPTLFTLLLSTLRKDQLPLLRMSAARALGRAPLDEAQVDSLLGAVAEAGALSLPRLLPAYERPHEPKIGMKLIAALEHAPGLPSVSAETLRRILGFYPAAVQQRAEPLLKRVTVDDQTRFSRLAELEPMLAKGDPTRGQEIFFSTKAACSMCHTVGDRGGHVGPDLSRIGSIRSGRDLLEAILFPSASFARGFEPFIIATSDGQVYTGIIYRETAEALFLVTGDRSERRLPRASIEAIEQGRTSVMPEGLDANLSRQELADIVSFLLSRQ
jgi:putative heme-binding domain-containing protein